MRIQHNILAMNAYRNYQNNTSALGKNLEKLSSGYRINRAGDDAAGLAISEKMRAQITGLDAAQKNVKDGISLVKTAEGAMQEIQDMLNRMDYLATQSANGTYQDEVDRENLQKEVNALRTEINRIADSSNFNGIKLLDGSLASEQSVTKIDLKGIAGTKSAGSKAKYEMSVAFGPYGATATKAAEGDVLTFNVGFEDGTSTSVKLKVSKDSAGNLKSLTSLDGKTTYKTSAADGVFTNAELGAAIEAALKETDLADEFTIASTNNKISLEALENGTGGRVVRSFDITAEGADGTVKKVLADPADNTNPTLAIGVTTTAGRDDGIEIDPTKITEYNGTNFDDAVFEINGKKFVVLADDNDPKITNKNAVQNADYLRAVAGVGSDVTVLVGGVGGLMKPATDTAPDGSEGAADPTAGGTSTDVANNNYEQNWKAIADATGLNVGDAVGETPATGVGAGAGFRLSLSNKKVEGKGLTLQIGDTADKFNQLTVNIGDMHDVGMGIQDIDISTQAGAQSAISTIKDAINYVSSIRGDLGAVQNRLEHTQNNLAVMQENIQDAESTIRDTDVAAEMMAYTKNNILVQSAQAMLAQANAVPQGVLQLLQ